MRDRYYRLTDRSEAPQRAALVVIWCEQGEMQAQIEGDSEMDVAAPDLVLFRAALMRIRDHRAGIFVRLEDPTLWQEAWGDLVDYRGGRDMQKPAPRGTPAFANETCLLAAWDYTLNLNSITSPSFTT